MTAESGEGYDQGLTIENIEGTESNALSGQLMVTKLKHDTVLDDKIPDTQTITIDRDQRTNILVWKNAIFLFVLEKKLF